MTNNTLIIAIGIIGAALIGAFVAIILLYTGDKAIAIAGLTAVAGLIIPQLLSLKASTENKALIADVKQSVAENTVTTDKTFVKVDGRMEQLLATVKQLAATQVALVEQTSMAAGIVIGQNTPVVDQDPALAIDPTLKSDVKPVVGDHR